MNKLYLSGSIVPALIIAGLACMIISYAAAGAPTTATTHLRTMGGHKMVQNTGNRNNADGQSRRHQQGDVPAPRQN